MSDTQPVVCEKKCACDLQKHQTRLVVLTGGPGAGKTAVLELAKKVLCEHVAVLPEAASIVFGGGFWRLESQNARLASQRAIFHIQKQMENLVLGEGKWAVGLCDRGTLDGLAYWPNNEKEFWELGQGSAEREYARYLAVIHLRSPTLELGYNQQNPLRIESAEQAKKIDDKIAAAWKNHPNYKVIESAPSFLDKANLALKYIAECLPACCQDGLSNVIENHEKT